ncbi:hypothetical protein KUTeg_000576 [Tegillarca granosa]|uniref:Uncharacterized protein n=1 Tax=Tegillarca granosa TaxID=220873 RepID=A0ABQ9G0P7_TEGGR|nr:hypothetical protein KUTeg_000576 [Tegillarca granosa]
MQGMFFCGYTDHLPLWILQVSLSLFTFVKSILHLYITSRNDLHLTKQRFQTISVTLSQQLFILIVTLVCLIFTTLATI